MAKNPIFSKIAAIMSKKYIKNTKFKKIIKFIYWGTSLFQIFG
jgi:hypothetical protein